MGDAEGEGLDCFGGASVDFLAVVATLLAPCVAGCVRPGGMRTRRSANVQLPNNVTSPTARTARNNKPSAIHTICRIRACRRMLSQSNSSQARRIETSECIPGVMDMDLPIAAKQIAKDFLCRRIEHFEPPHLNAFLDHEPAKIPEKAARIASANHNRAHIKSV